MSDFVLLTLLLVVAVLVGGLVTLALKSRLNRVDLFRKTVIVHTVDEQNIRGILVEQHADSLSLAESSYLHGGKATAIEGRTHIPLRNVSWIQEILAVDVIPITSEA